MSGNTGKLVCRIVYRGDDSYIFPSVHLSFRYVQRVRFVTFIRDAWLSNTTTCVYYCFNNEGYDALI